MKAILVVHQGAIGDFILSLPAFEALHRSFPQATFILLGRPAILALIRARPYVGLVLDSADACWAPLYRQGASLSEKQRCRLLPAERIFVFGRASSDILASNLAGHLDKPAHRLEPFPNTGCAQPVAEYQCQQLEALGIPALPPPAAIIAPPPEEVQEAELFLRRNLAADQRLVLIHPGSGSKGKLWPLAGWLELLPRLAATGSIRLGLLQGPADSEIVEGLCARLPRLPLLLVKDWPLARVAALMASAALYIGNDSGITHLASECGRPTIALFGPTDPRLWGPQGSRVSIIRWRPGTTAPLEPKPSHRSRQEAMRVWQQAKEWLGLQ